MVQVKNYLGTKIHVNASLLKEKLYIFLNVWIFNRIKERNKRDGLCLVLKHIHRNHCRDSILKSLNYPRFRLALHGIIKSQKNRAQVTQIRQICLSPPD